MRELTERKRRVADFQRLFRFKTCGLLPKTRLFSRESPRIFEQSWRRGSKMGEGEEKRGNTHRRKGESVARDVKKQQGKENKQSLPVADFVNIEMGEFLGKEGG